MDLGLREIIEKLEIAEGYMLCVSLLDKNRQIENVLITEKFELVDMLPSHGETRKLIIEQLETPPQQQSQQSIATLQ